jgi:hypothetical protein
MPALLDATRDHTDGSDTLVIDLINVSLQAMDGDRLLFPFLVLEAKSGKATDDWYSIKLQSCFPIRSALEIQRQLRLTNGSRSRWIEGPLVWFIMSRGEDWRVSFAFVEEDDPHNPNDAMAIYVSAFQSRSDQ